MPSAASDHSEVYRGIPIWIAAEYVERCQKWKLNAIKEARDEVDAYLEYMEKTKNEP